VTLGADTAVTASFALQFHSLSVSNTGTGSGVVASSPAGIACGDTCAWDYLSGTVITLTADPAIGSSFSGWGGACSGTDPCAVTLVAAASVNADFTFTGFTDSFTDPDALGNGWTVPSGSFSVQGGKLWSGTQKGLHLAILPSIVLTSGTLSATFTSPSNNGGPSFGLVFGYRDSLNYYAAYRHAGGSAGLRIVRVIGGVETVLAKAPCPNPALNQGFSVAVSFGPQGVVLTAAGKTLTASLPAIDQGAVGPMIVSGGPAQMADDFSAAP
jgi:hypothetical protein